MPAAATTTSPALPASEAAIWSGYAARYQKGDDWQTFYVVATRSDLKCYNSQVIALHLHKLEICFTLSCFQNDPEPNVIFNLHSFDLAVLGVGEKNPGHETGIGQLDKQPEIPDKSGKSLVLTNGPAFIRFSFGSHVEYVALLKVS